MPTVRLNYISNHPTTKLAKLHTDMDMIAPTWGKISASVWLVHCFTSFPTVCLLTP